MDDMLFCRCLHLAALTNRDIAECKPCRKSYTIDTSKLNLMSCWKRVLIVFRLRLYKTTWYFNLWSNLFWVSCRKLVLYIFTLYIVNCFVQNVIRPELKEKMKWNVDRSSPSNKIHDFIHWSDILIRDFYFHQKMQANPLSRFVTSWG